MNNRTCENCDYLGVNKRKSFCKFYKVYRDPNHSRCNMYFNKERVRTMRDIDMILKEMGLKGIL